MNSNPIQSEELIIKIATKEDAETVLFFIKQLAEYEKLSHQVTATEETLIENLFSKNSNA